MDRRRIYWTVGTIAVVAVALRVAAVVALKAWNSPNGMEHSFIAFAMTKGWGFSFADFGYLGPTTVQSPVYPTLLYLGFRAFGAWSPAAYAACMFFNAIVGGVVVVLAYALARTVGAGTKVALLAAALVAVWPSQVYAVTQAQAVVLITAIQAAMVVFFYRGVRSGKAWDWVAFSVVACLGALTEPALLPISALSGLLVLNWPSLQVTQRLRNAAILLVAAVVIIGPWSVRNRMVFHKWIPIKGTFWINVWKGANDYATGTDRVRLSADVRKDLMSEQMLSLSDADVRDPNAVPHHRDTLTTAQVMELWGKPELEQDKVFHYWAVTWMKAHPQRVVELCFARLGKTIWIDWDNPKSWNIAYIVPRALLLLGTAAGLVLAVRKRWSLLYPGLLIGSCVALYTVTLTAARFAIPFEPLQLALSAQALVSAWAWVRARVGSASEGRMAMASSAALEAS